MGAFFRVEPLVMRITRASAWRCPSSRSSGSSRSSETWAPSSLAADTIANAAVAERVSIRDLAKLAGVSRTTVSLALRGSHEVSAATRKRIHALARKHDYRSHPAVNALMQQVGRGVRVHDEEILAYIRTGKDADETTSGPLEILAGAREAAHTLGYRIEVFWAGYMGESSLQLARILYHRGIRGVIWGTMPYPHPPLEFPWQHFVPVACSLSVGVRNLPVISIHHAKGMALVLEELHQRGAKRIGFLGGVDDDLRLDYGWSLGVDLYRHRGGDAKVFRHLYRNTPEEDRVLLWIRRCRLNALVLTQEMFTKSQYLEGRIPMVSLDTPTAKIGEVAGLHQNAFIIGKHAVTSLAVRLSNGILGIPEHPFSVTTQATFVDGKSLAQLC